MKRKLIITIVMILILNINFVYAYDKDLTSYTYKASESVFDEFVATYGDYNYVYELIETWDDGATYYTLYASSYDMNYYLEPDGDTYFEFVDKTQDHTYHHINGFQDKIMTTVQSAGIRTRTGTGVVNVEWNVLDLNFDYTDLPPFPFVEIAPDKYVPMKYQIVVKKGSAIYIYQSDTAFYALNESGVNFIYVYDDEFQEERYVHKHKLQDNEWIPVQNKVDYMFELSVGYYTVDYDYFDEFIYISSSIMNYETGEIAFNRTIDIDTEEPYITFEYPNSGYAHTTKNIEFKVNYNVPVGGNTKHRPLISNSTNFNLLEHNYVEKNGYYQGYFIFTSDVQEGYTNIIASYHTDTFDDSVTVTTYYDIYIVDSDGDGIDDNTNLPIADSVITADIGGLKQSFEDKLQFSVLENSMKKLETMNTAKGTAPVIYLNLNKIFDAGTKHINSSLDNPFPDANTVFIDFSVLDDIDFLGLSVVDYFRNIFAAGMIWLTFMYCWRKVVPRQVVS